MTMLILDALLILIVGWGMFYAWRTSAKMQTIKNEMKPVTRQLGTYLTTIGDHLKQFKAVTESNKQTLSKQVPEAQALREDFEAMLDHGNRLAERLDKLLDQAYSVEKDLRNMNQNIVEQPQHQSQQTMYHTTDLKGRTIRYQPYTNIMLQGTDAPPPHFKDDETYIDAMDDGFEHQHPVQDSQQSVQQKPQEPVGSSENVRQLAMEQVAQARSAMMQKLRGQRI